MITKRLAAVVAAVALLGASGCDSKDPLQVAVQPTPATPASAPSPSVSPRGTVWPVGDAADAVAVDPRQHRLAVGVRNPDRLVLLDARTGRRVGTVPLAGPARQVIALAAGGFRTVAGSELVTVPATGQPVRSTLPVAGEALTELPDGGTAVTLPDRAEAVLLRADGSVRHTLAVGGHPSSIAVSGDRVAVVDGLSTSLITFRLDSGVREQGLRAGNGAATVVGVRNNRFVVLDTRNDELLIFSVDPLFLRQRYPAHGAPYGGGYDSDDHLLWVSLTARNEVVGFDLAGGAPRVVVRYPTVQQPDAVAVDAINGAIFVTGRAAGVVQVISR